MFAVRIMLQTLCPVYQLKNQSLHCLSCLAIAKIPLNSYCTVTADPLHTRLDINKINPCGIHPWLALRYVKSELQKIEYISLNNTDQSPTNLPPLKIWTSSILGSSVLHGNT